MHKRTRKSKRRTGGAASGGSQSKVRRESVAALRQHLAKMLEWSDAHLSFDEVLREWPAELRGVKPAGAAPRLRSGQAHTAWQLVEHMRIAQWDILEFSRNAKHVSPEFPAGYWPKTEAPPDNAAWDASLAAFRADLKAMQRLVEDPKTSCARRCSWLTITRITWGSW